MTLLKSSFDDQVLEAQIPLTLDAYTNWEVPSGESAMIYIGVSGTLSMAGTLTVGGDLLILSAGGSVSFTGTLVCTGDMIFRNI